MTALLYAFTASQCDAPAVCATIGQECDARVTLACEELESRAADADLVLLVDARIGHADMREIRSIGAPIGR